MSSDQSGIERRRSPRYPNQSRGTAYVLCNSQITAMEVETRNISDGGVLIVSNEFLEGDRMMLKLDIPGYEGALIECDVAHRSEFERWTFTEDEDNFFACGLSFQRVIPIDNLHETLRSAFDLSESASLEDNFHPARENATESLVPLLSAVGLAVVYASQYSFP